MRNLRHSDAAPATTSSPPDVLWALLSGNFVIGTGVMVVPGTLNEISASLGVSVAAVGQLISAAALMMCVGAPVLATVAAGWDRRRLLVASLLWYGLLHLLCAAMPNLAALFAARVLAVVAAAVFTPQATACVGLLTPPAARGRAITFVFLGWSAASVLGMPLAAWIGGSLGWRSAFVLVGLMSLGCAAWLWRAMPEGIRPPALSSADWRATLQSRPLMLCVLVTVLSAAGQFVLSAYIAPYYKQRFGASPLQLGLLFAWFGLFGFIGNVWMSHRIDRLGPTRAVALSLAGIALSLLLWPLGDNLALAALIIVPWALGCFSSNSAQQARLVALAPALAAGSIALNTSAMYAGQALGAASGGWLIARGQLHLLSWTGLAGLGLALLASRRASTVSDTPRSQAA